MNTSTFALNKFKNFSETLKLYRKDIETQSKNMFNLPNQNVEWQTRHHFLQRNVFPVAWAPNDGGHDAARATGQRVAHRCWW